MQKCNICNFPGNPADAKYCIECASKLPVMVNSGPTTKLGWTPVLLSGMINDTYGQLEIGIISSGSYSPFLQPYKYIPSIGQLENDILYITREEYYTLIKDTHFFQAFSQIGQEEPHMYFHGYVVKIRG